MKQGKIMARKSNFFVFLVIMLIVILASGFILDWIAKSIPANLTDQEISPRVSGPVNLGPEGNLSQWNDALPEIQSGPNGPIVGYAAKHDTSPPLREIKIVPTQPVEEIREMGEGDEEMENIVSWEPRPQIQDPVLQAQFSPGGLLAPSAAMPAPLQNFAGVSNLDSVYPPDTIGDIGPKHYVQMVNLHFQIFNRNGVSLYGPAANNTLWSGFGAPCETRNDGDPVVLYDSIADRWLLSQFTAANPYGECVAVSTTSDPTGSYYRYFFQFSTSVFYDYPKLGVWPDGYYLTANRFTGNTFSGASAIVLNRTAMLNGLAAGFQRFNTSTAYGVLLPSDLDGPTQPPTGSPNFILEIGTTALHLWKFHVDWVTPANSTLSGPTSLTVASFNILCQSTRNCVPQPGTSVGLDGLGDRLMQRLVYRNFGDHESLLVSHNVNAASSGTQAGVRWYEVRNPNGSAAIYQQGTYAPDTNNRWTSSVAMDRNGDIAVGYSVSSSSVYPSIRYAGRLSTDPLGTLAQTETTLISGGGSQTGTAYRWGDYASMSIDPVDDCTFWFTTEYLATGGTAPWLTRVGSFKFPSCNNPTAVTFAQMPQALSQPGKITLSWETAQEMDLVGFNVWRSESADNHGTKISNSMIVAQAAGSLGGAGYSFDDVSIQPGRTYNYWIELVETGGSSFVEPSSQVFAPYYLMLPGVVR
jgi:hypothetical protein